MQGFGGRATGPTRWGRQQRHSAPLSDGKLEPRPVHSCWVATQPTLQNSQGSVSAAYSISRWDSCSDSSTAHHCAIQPIPPRCRGIGSGHQRSVQAPAPVPAPLPGEAVEVADGLAVTIGGCGCSAVFSSTQQTDVGVGKILKLSAGPILVLVILKRITATKLCCLCGFLSTSSAHRSMLY